MNGPAVKRDWTNPLTNPIGEAIYPLLAFAVKFLPKPYDSPKPVVEDEPEFWSKTYKFCKDCKTETLFVRLWWPVEQEFTIECEECGGVFCDGE